MASALQAQYAYHMLHVIGIQEGRRPAFAKASQHYFMISSGAENGLYGCELWFSRFIPFAGRNEKENCFRMNQLFVIVAKPRLLVVQFTSTVIQIRFISAHAPSSNHPEERAHFFKELQFYALYEGPTIMFIDGNGRLNLCTDKPAHGTPKRLVHAAWQLRDFLNSANLSTTFDIDQYRNNVSGTWTCADSGRLHTLDYVAYNQIMSNTVCHASVLQDVDNGHLVQDHWPSACSFAFMRQWDATHTAGDAVKAHRVTNEQLLDQDARRKFSHMLSCIPSPAWEVPLDQHYEILRRRIIHAIRTAFPPQKLVAKKPYIYRVAPCNGLQNRVPSKSKFAFLSPASSRPTRFLTIPRDSSTKPSIT
jgi:hypothetical protein